MAGQRTTFKLIVTASFSTIVAPATAQSQSMDLFAMSLHQYRAQAQQTDFGSTMHLEYTDHGTEPSSISVLLSDSSNQRGGFHTPGMSNTTTGIQRGNQQHGINARELFSPKTDELFVVPLPPAAFAGFGLLAGVAGVRYMRGIKD